MSHCTTVAVVGGFIVLVAVMGCTSSDHSKKTSSETKEGTSGNAVPMTPGDAGTSTGGTGGSASPCPTDPGIMMCGTEACAPVEATLAQICVQTCCTEDMKCGTLNASPIGSKTCAPKLVDSSMCPAETILGTSVPGCCADGTLCGLQDVSGVLGGGCVARCMVSTLVSGIANVNCTDGTPAGMCAAATGGAGGSGGMTGTGATGAGAGGTGGS
jgi:hypothetical protein